LQYALLGLLGGVIFELPSRNLKKILIKGALCALALIIGYSLASLLPNKYVSLRNIIYGLCLGIAFSLSARRITSIVIISLLGSAVFALTHISLTALPFAILAKAVIRGAWIGLVLGFGYAYVTRSTETTNLISE
jgi:hypothetical protein